MLRPLVAVILALGAFCAPAQAARTVARDGPFTLRARERGDRLCMTLLRKFGIRPVTFSICVFDV